MENKLYHPEVNVDGSILLPRTVVQVETAVPAFIGYTEKAYFDGKDLHSANAIQPFEINSLSEYERIFGGAPEPASVEFELDDNYSVVSLKTEQLSFLYYAVKLFFDNFGTTCLVVSVGSYSNAADKVSKQQLLEGLTSLQKTDFPTLLVMPDSVKLSYAEAGELHAAMLHQCHKLKNRFALLDLTHGHSRMDGKEKPLDGFRKNLKSEFLSYGAAYYPWVISTWSPRVTCNVLFSAKYIKSGVEVKDLSTLFFSNSINALRISRLYWQKDIKLNKPDLNLVSGTEYQAALAIELYEYMKKLYDFISYKERYLIPDPFQSIHLNLIAKGSDFNKLVERFFVLAIEKQLPLDPRSFFKDFKSYSFPLHTLLLYKKNRTRKPSFSKNLKKMVADTERLAKRFFGEIDKMHSEIQRLIRESDKMYDYFVRALEAHRLIVPPAGAVAGVLSRIDRKQGVWKVPSGENVNSVICPAVEVLHQDQEFLTTDAETGISVNAMLFLPQMGAKLQGGLTLAGFDKYWRYLNHRRFCIMVEQSVNEAIHPFSFEPNNEVTWIRIRSVTENFLNSFWEAGALKGKKPEQAYFVMVGTGETMTASDVENGLMILHIGLALEKPSEFVTLSISRKMFTS